MVGATTRLETDRLLLRRWDVDGDLDAYAAICADPEIMPSVEIGWRLGREHWGRLYAIDRPATG